jgi:RNA polymerase sigma factor (sigma-70 family)
MRPDLVRTLTRRLEAVAADPGPDAELVRRFAAGRDPAAFAALVRRHGPMVWGTCRHLLAEPADAEDAFQATFLALVRSAGSIRTPAAVGAWLHGVAVRAAAKVKRTAARRKKRERAAASAEATPAPVPDGKWEAALAAVHDEVGRLPEPLRAAFVLCELEGVPPADAAARLGWKPGTLSGRLTRARQRLLGRLARRGLAPAAGLGVVCTPAAAPARVVDAVLTFPTAAGAVPAAVAHLANGATDMSRTKRIAAAVLVAGGLAAGAWARLAPAGAQAPPAGAARPAAQPDLPLPQALAVDAGRPVPAWEFKYYAAGTPLTLWMIEEAAGKFAPDGWEYSGAVTLTLISDEEKKRIEGADANTFKLAAARAAGFPGTGLTVLVFKRPAKRVAANAVAEQLFAQLAAEAQNQNVTGDLLKLAQKQFDQAAKWPPAAGKVAQARVLEAKIAELQKQLNDLRAETKKTAVLTHKDLGAGTDLSQVMTALVALADARYGADGRRQRLSFSHGNVGPDFKTEGLTVEGDPDAVDWIVEVAGKLKK